MDEYNCTICLEEISKDALKVCDCNNTVHIHCLLEWINHKNSTTCEICKSQYKINEIVLNEYLTDIYNQIEEEIEEEEIEEEIEEENYQIIIERYIFNIYNFCNIYNQKIRKNLLLLFLSLVGIYTIYLFYNLYQDNKNNKNN